jgi:hypothetical protein
VVLKETGRKQITVPRVGDASAARTGFNRRRVANACRLLLAMICCANFLNTQLLHAQSQDDEYRVKAAFLYHFAQLVEWPPDALKPNDRQLLLCTLGEDPFQGKLESTIEGKLVENRTLRVRHFASVSSDLRGCQILFIGHDESKHLGVALAAVQNSAVMTVGETDSFLAQGGVISFSLHEARIRFEINLTAAEKSHLKISSRLLLLASRVIGNISGER